MTLCMLDWWSDMGTQAVRGHNSWHQDNLQKQHTQICGNNELCTSFTHNYMNFNLTSFQTACGAAKSIMTLFWDVHSMFINFSRTQVLAIRRSMKRTCTVRNSTQYKWKNALLAGAWTFHSLTGFCKNQRYTVLTLNLCIWSNVHEI